MVVLGSRAVCCRIGDVSRDEELGISLEVGLWIGRR